VGPSVSSSSGFGRSSGARAFRHTVVVVHNHEGGPAPYPPPNVAFKIWHRAEQTLNFQHDVEPRLHVLGAGEAWLGTHIGRVCRRLE